MVKKRALAAVAAVCAAALLCAAFCSCAKTPGANGNKSALSEPGGKEEQVSESVPETVSEEGTVSIPCGESEEEMVSSGSTTSKDTDPDFCRALISAGAVCEVSVVSDGETAFLTDGLVNDLMLDTDGVLFCRAGGKSFDITVDLGTVRKDVKYFDLWSVSSASYAGIASMRVFTAGEDRQFSAATGVVSFPERAPTAMGRIYLLEAEAETPLNARYVKFSITPRGTNAAAFAECGVYRQANDGFPEYVPAEEPVYDRAPETIEVPHVSWSFITTMSLNGVSAEMAEEYFDTLGEAGITGLVILHGSDAAGKVYANSALDHVFAQSQKRGMKVIMGMNPANDIYGDTEGFVSANARALNALYARYGEPYPDVFYGWYMTHEFSNGDLHAHPDETANIINAVMENINAVTPGLPLMLSPYCTSWGGGDKQLKEDLEKIFSNINEPENVIYCPQDGVGCGYFNTENAGDYLSAAAVVCKRHGAEFWVNLENFILDSSVPDGDDDIPAPVTRFIKQIRTAAKYASVLATFTYESYMPEYFSNYTIYNDIESYHLNYLYYLNTGKLPGETAPGDIKAEISDDLLTIRFPSPTYGVSAVKLTRGGGERWFSGRLLREYGSETYLTLPNDAYDEPFSVTVYDRSANSSGACRFEKDGSPSQTGGPPDRTRPARNAALYKSYTTSGATHSNGDGGNELTDGKHGKADFFDAAWQGCNSSVFEVIIDLGEYTENIGDIRIEALGGGYGAVMEPKSFEVAVSSDGSVYETVGEQKCSDEGTGSAYIKTLELQLAEAAAGRYVRITVNVLGWFFTDEIEIITYG